MAASLASDRPNLPAPGDNDPFVTSTPAPPHHRYSAFDHDLFASGPASSPGQAKRALEAHLTETERRLEEAGKLGTALVSQRKALTEQLQEIEKLQAEGELNPELRQKLVDIEKEYNDLARESARAFLPKQRVPSNEANPNSPFVPEGRSGRRSVSPSKFESQATGSPTKLSVPNRKLRNQPSNRVHDIEFAAEISTSLIAQVRNLQALLAEREEDIKDLKYDKSILEIESENFQQRLKALDESEHRYKEENWNLETKLQEISAQQKDAADREKKLTQSLNLLKSEKVAVQKELDEVKLSNSKLTEEHSAAVKHLDIELGTAKRNMAMAESERSAMQRKIDELTSQNQELAKAFSIQRGRTLEREATMNSSDDDREASTDQMTPEHSPPPSPIKGTPRHSMLETETMKSSLHHAQRTIQSQRSLLHREKTEKLELRRIIQDLRDDLEKSRTESNSSSSNRRSRKVESRDSKRVPRLLGSFRSSRQEVVHDDPDWEDQQDLSPRTSPIVSPVLGQTATFSTPADTSDHFETANEGGESAFETANERGTETEDFQTVNEEFSGSDDADTETEERPSRGFGRMKQTPSLPAGLARHGNRDSFISTASTSADEDDFAQLRTPTATISSQRSSRFRYSRGVFSRTARQASEEPVFRSSPASFTSSAAGTPQGGQSLFAELQDFEGSDEESIGGATPSRRGIRSTTPGSFSQIVSPVPAVPALPKVAMVDSGMMTEPVKFAPTLRDLQISGFVDPAEDESVPGSPVSVVARGRPISMESVAGPIGNRFSHPWPSIHEEDLDDSRPVSMIYSDAGAQHDPDMEEKLAQFPAPPTLVPILPPTLSMSSISSEAVEPREEVHIPPSLSLTSILNQSLEPQAEPEIPPPKLSISGIMAEDLEPRAVPPPELSLSRIATEDLEPQAVPPPALSMSSIAAEHLEPQAVPPPALCLSSISAEHLEPQAVPPPALSLSGIAAEHLEPVPVPPPQLSLSDIAAEHLEPRAVPPPQLSLSSIAAEDLEPQALPPPTLTMSSIAAEHLEPRAVPPPALSLSSISAEYLEPRAVPPPKLSLSGIAAEHLEPQAVPPPELSLSGISAEHLEPQAVPPPQLSLSSISAEHLEPQATPPPELSLSNISAEHLEPRAVPPPDLSFSSINAEHLEPRAEPEVPPPNLSLSNIAVEHLAPQEIPPPELSISSIIAEGLEPVAELEIPPPALSMSSIFAENLEPRAEPEILPPDLGLSTIMANSVEPRAEPEEPLPQLTLSTLATEVVEPIAEPQTPMTVLGLSTIVSESLEPVEEPEVKPVMVFPPPPSLTLSQISGEHVQPVSPIPPALSLSPLSREHVEPVALEPPQLGMSTITAEHLEPIAEPPPKLPEPVLPTLSLSTVRTQHIEPIAEPEPEVSLRAIPERPQLNISSILSENVEPVAEPELKAPEPLKLSLTAITSAQCEPIAEPEPEPILPPVPELSISTIMHEHVRPVAAMPPALTLSALSTEHLEPRPEPEPVVPQLTISPIRHENVQPVVAVPPALGLSAISTEDIEPRPEPEPVAPQLSISPIQHENIHPVAAIPPALALSAISTERVEPRPEPEPVAPQLSMSSIRHEIVEPVVTEPPALATSSIMAESVDPIPEPAALPPSLNLSSIYTEHLEPKDEPLFVSPPPALTYSHLSTQNVEPMSEPEPLPPSLAFSSISVENVKPILEPKPHLVLSSIAAEGVEPVSLVIGEPEVPGFDFSQIQYVETRPISPRSPKRDGFVLPRGMQYPFLGQGLGLTSNKIFGSSIARTQDRELSPIIAEDETSQSLDDVFEDKTSESRQPFQEISSNLNHRPTGKAAVETSDQGAQTALTADVIDEMFKARSRSSTSYDKNASVASFGTPATTGTVRIRRSQDSFSSPLRSKGKYADEFASDTGSVRRPGSAASDKQSIQEVPPLPSNHRQVIEAARSGSAHGSQTNMPPPLWPASALKQRPITPSQTRPMSRGTPTPRPGRVAAGHGSLDVPSQKLSAISRQSSVSSFASELDTRFNMRPGDMGIDPTGFGPNTDPRMIQAITQTMIGEYLWKYTRKTGRGEMSGSRHRRYFWVHPYTRTLYWSERDPTTAGRAELKTKSVPIEAVRVVTDDNPMPPGLHRKSLVIISPGRTVKFTCTTGQRHETWFNALSYLLLRTNNANNNIDNHSDAEDMTENITREDVEEFNPQYGRQFSRPRAPPSLSSYNSRTTRNESPAVGTSMNIPTLTPHKASGQRANTGTLGKLSGYWKSSQVLSGTFSSRRGRGVSGQDTGIYEASEVHDSAEDLREMIERQDREADRLENVRACCDGKHDVGTLHHHRRGRQHSHAHTNIPSTSTPMASMRSRA